MGEPVYSASVDCEMINAIDGCGGQVCCRSPKSMGKQASPEFRGIKRELKGGSVGQTVGHGPPEVVTGGRDGAVRVWDVRQADAPVASFPAEASSDQVRERPAVGIEVVRML